MGAYTDNHKDEFPSYPTKNANARSEADIIIDAINDGTWWDYAGFGYAGATPKFKEEEQVTPWQKINYNASWDPINKFLDEYVKKLAIPPKSTLSTIQANAHGGAFDLDIANEMRDELLATDGGTFAGGGTARLEQFYEFYGYLLGVPKEALPAPGESDKGSGWWPLWINDDISIDGETIDWLNSEIEDSKDMLVWLYLNVDNARKNEREESNDAAEKAGADELARRLLANDDLSLLESLKIAQAKEIQKVIDAGGALTPEQLQLLEELDDDDTLQEKILEATTCLLRLNLGSYMKASSEQGGRDYTIDRYAKQVYKAYGNCTDLLNKLAHNPDSDNFMVAPTHELSNLVPTIRLFKTYHNKGDSKITKEVEFMFDGGTSLGPLNSKGGVGIKSFDWKLNATNPATVRNDIEATMVLYFQRFDDLLKVRRGIDTISAQRASYRYEDLLLRPPGGNNTKKEISAPSDDVDCKRDSLIYDPSFYEVKAIVGWAPNLNSGTIAKSVESQQLPLFLTLIDHEFNFTQEGTFELTITYRARMESQLNDPRMDVLTTTDAKEKLNLINERINDLRKACGSEKTIEKYQDRAARIREKGRDHFASTIIEDLEDKIYISKFNKLELTKAISGFHFGEDPEEFIDNTSFNNSALPDSQPRLRQAKASVVMLVHNEEDVRKDIGNTERSYEDIIRKQLTERLKDSYSPSHPTAKKEAEKKTNPEPDKTWGDTFSELPSFSRPDLHIAAGFAASQDFFGIESTADLEERGLFKKEARRQTEGNTYEYRNTEIENVGFIQDGRNIYMPWFYFGDLVNVAIEHCFKNIMATSEKNTSAIGKQDLDNLIILMGPFNLYGTTGSGWEHLNGSLADVPISLELFNQWFVKRIIERERDSYPLLEFLRDIAKDLALSVINRKCWDTPAFRAAWREQNATWWEAKKVIIKSASLSLPSKENIRKVEGIEQRRAFLNKPGENPLEVYRRNPSASKKTNAVSQVDLNFWESDIQTLTRRKNSYEQTLNNSYHLFTLYVVQEDNYKELGPPPSWQTREDRDSIRGIYHLFLAADRGLVKSVGFSKVDAPYLREARIQQDSLNPLAQLAATYNVNLKLIGNTIFWPGQYIFVNPVGFGHGLGPPDEIGTPSNQLGLGGYHLITSVTNFIEDGKFETEVKALFEFSGDGCPSLPKAQDSSGCGSSPSSGATKAVEVPAAAASVPTTPITKP